MHNYDEYIDPSLPGFGRKYRYVNHLTPQVQLFDSSGAIVVGATVELKLRSTFWTNPINPNYEQYFYATTDKDGVATFNAWPWPTFGTYHIRIGNSVYSSVHSLEIDTMTFTSGSVHFTRDCFRLAMVQ